MPMNFEQNVYLNIIFFVFQKYAQYLENYSDNSILHSVKKI